MSLLVWTSGRPEIGLNLWTSRDRGLDELILDVGLNLWTSRILELKRPERSRDRGLDELILDVGLNLWTSRILELKRPERSRYRGLDELILGRPEVQTNRDILRNFPRL
jgi:hypothetical protein